MIQTSELLSMSGLSENSFTSPLTKENKLVNRMLKGDMRLAVKARAKKMVHLDLTAVNIAKLTMLTHGALSPLTGFMGQEDYESVLYDMRLNDETVWSMPITLTVDESMATSIAIGQEIALCENGRILAVIEVSDKFEIDKTREAALLYQTTDPTHIGVQQTQAQNNIAIGGDIWVIDMPTVQHNFYDIQFTPAQTRRMFARRGWRRIVGYAPTSPLYRTQEYVQKTALELVDGLFILHTINNRASMGVTAVTSLLSYQSILQNYYPTQNILLGIYPGFLQNAGPRELLFWALIHKNYGCTHFIVSDTASQKNHLIFESFTKEELGIIWLPFQKTYFCTQCEMIVSQKTCPHGDSSAISLTDKEIKKQIKSRKINKTQLIRHEVAQILSES